MFSTRTAKCSQNADVVDFLCLKRDEFLAEGSKYATPCEKACKSLCDHPVPIYSAEARKLKFVGQRIIKILKPFFEERTRAPASVPTPQPSPAEPSGKFVLIPRTILRDLSLPSNLAFMSERQGGKKILPYEGFWCICCLDSLLKAHQSGKAFLKRQEIWDEVDKSGLSNEPMRPTDQSGFYNAWSGVSKTLIPKGLVSKTNNPAKYKLTDEGFIVAQECTERAGLGPVKRPKIQRNV